MDASSSLSHTRKDAFKQGINRADCRKKRLDLTNNIRKNKRMSNLRKRRNLVRTESEPSTDVVPTTNTEVFEVDVKELPNYKRALQTKNIDIMIAATKSLRKLLSGNDEDPPVKEVLDSGILQLLLTSLTINNDELQFETCWALTNISATEYTREMVEAGALPHLVPLLRTTNADVREQSGWCIGNIAGEGPDMRNLILHTPSALESLLLNIQQPANLTIMRNIIWTVSNLCRGKPAPEINLINDILPVLYGVLKTPDQDEECIGDALWAISYLSDGSEHIVDRIIETGYIKPIISLLSKYRKLQNYKIVSPALRTLGNIITGNDSQCQAVLDGGFLSELLHLLQDQKLNIRKEAAWAASNIAAGTKAQIGSLLTMPGVTTQIMELTEADWVVRKEAAWAVCNICTMGSPENVRCVVETYNAIPALCRLLNENQTEVVLIVLDAIECCLKVDAKKYVVMIDIAGGIDTIEELQHSNSDKVYRKANHILTTYFGDESDEDDIDDLNVFDFDAGNVENEGVWANIPDNSMYQTPMKQSTTNFFNNQPTPSPAFNFDNIVFT